MAGNAVIGALRVVLGADSAELETGLRAASAKIDAFAKRLNVVALAAASALTVGLFKLGDSVKHAVDQADELGKTAQKIGVPIEELSKLKYAADLSGVSLEGLSTGVGKLSKNMAEMAATGSGEAAGAFKALGLSVKDASGNLRPASEVMAEIAGRFAATRDGAEKTALAMALFGKSGRDLIPLLNGGADGLRDMYAEAERLGLVISGDTFRAAEAFNDNMTRLGRVWDGLVLKITAGLAPSLQIMTGALVQASQSGSGLGTVSEAVAAAVENVITAVVAASLALERLGATWTAVKALLSTPGGLFDPASWDLLRQRWDAYVAVIEGNKAAFAGLADRVKAVKDQLFAAGAASAAIKPAAPILQGTAAAATSAADAMTRFFTATEKRRAGLEAELQTIGLSAAAHEALRVKLEAEALAKQNNITITEALRQKIDATAQGYGTLVGQLEAARNRFGALKEAGDRIGASLENAFSSAIVSGTKLSEVAKSLLQDFSRLAINLAFRNLLGGAGAEGNIITQGLNAVFGGSFAGGGSFVVPGAGGIDSTLAMMRVTPGERVTVTKDGEPPRGASRSSSVTVHAPVTVVAPEPAKFAQSRGQISRTIGQAWQRAQRFN